MAAGAPGERTLEVYEQGKHTSEQARDWVRKPITITSPSYGRDGEVVVPKSRDGHHYVHGFLNGFPVVFLIDTGASITTIPLRYARPGGIRAGVIQDMQTGGGVAKISVSEENRVGVGPVALDSMHVAVARDIPLAVLGMNALQRFSMTVDERGTMTLKLLR
ncbi:retroviral-like aspartic protease family protein [Ottowia sp.]|uniref:retropepsin-like aspartic protease family protein n=1 Tax=Ottowia sp. TaxID=1898956 RepID=UPI0025F60054|nr:retroviral-like aspartic protease family protein [Ottowia sp.]